MVSFENAIRIWESDSGYRKINKYLCATYPGEYISGNINKIIDIDNNTTYDTQQVVDMIKSGMNDAPNNKTIKYYRGERCKIPSLGKNMVKRTFVSVSTNIENASGYAVASSNFKKCVFRLIVDPHVLRVKLTGEDEVLLENDCLWEYTDEEQDTLSLEGDKYEVKNIHVYPPNSKNMEKYLDECKIKPIFNIVDLQSYYNDFIEEDLEEDNIANFISYVKSINSLISESAIRDWYNSNSKTKTKTSTKTKSSSRSTAYGKHKKYKKHKTIRKSKKYNKYKKYKKYKINKTIRKV